MKKFTTIALSAAIAMFGATAYGASDSGQITINVDVAAYINVTILDGGVVTYDVTDPTVAKNHAGGGSTLNNLVRFTVQANVAHNIDVDYPTWDSGTWEQADFAGNNGYSIGGTPFLTSEPGVTNTNNQILGNSAGELWVNPDDNSRGTTAAKPATVGGGTHTWGLGANISPYQISDSNVAIAAPDLYSMTATVVASQHP